jgi:hypothetical protein
MSRFSLPPQIAPAIGLVALLAATLACSLPFQASPAQPSISSPVVATEASGAGGENEIPSNVLTEVAATLFAPHLATWTAQAALPPTNTPPAKPAAPAQPTAAQPTQALPTAAEASPTSQPTQAQQATPSEALPTAGMPVTPTIVPLPTAYQPAYPPASMTTQSGKAFTIFGLNLANCGGTYAANFLIDNTGSQALESLSLQFIDLSSDEDLYGPNISNEPFMWNDRNCTPGGIDRLEAGDWLFSGGLLGPGQLSGHTILANFLFCTGEDLTGQCYPRSVEFVVP